MFIQVVERANILERYDILSIIFILGDHKGRQIILKWDYIHRESTSLTEFAK